MGTQCADHILTPSSPDYVSPLSTERWKLSSPGPQWAVEPGDIIHMHTHYEKFTKTAQWTDKNKETKVNELAYRYIFRLFVCWHHLLPSQLLFWIIETWIILLASAHIWILDGLENNNPWTVNWLKIQASLTCETWPFPLMGELDFCAGLEWWCLRIHNY